MFQALLQGARELFFPDNCLLCRRFLNSGHRRQLCPQCLKLLEFNNGKNICDGTQNHYAFDQAWAVCLYNETAQKLLHAFKYHSKTSLHKTFVPLMIDFVERHQIPVR
jgi:predicted amidophosphoribosyltransferase